MGWWGRLFSRGGRSGAVVPASTGEFLAGRQWAGVGLDATTEAGQPLSEPLEQAARRLAELVVAESARYDSLSRREGERHRDFGYLDAVVRGETDAPGWLQGMVEIRAIGHQLNDQGGKPLMRSVAERASVVGRSRVILALINSDWNGIGDWMS